MNATRALIKTIISNPYHFNWSYQGLGMLRLYLNNNIRLHIWNPNKKVKNVSQLHTHPWHFSSEIISGKIKNVRFFEVEKHIDGKPYFRTKLKCGTGGGVIGKPKKVFLHCESSEIFSAGDCYGQQAHEIHYTTAFAGTITLVDRIFTKDTEHAFVYWSKGKWISAEPRKASQEEIKEFTTQALKIWIN